MRSGKRRALVLAAATVAGLVQVSRGANATWSGADSFWNAANWDNGGPYTVVPGDALFFAANGTTSTRNDFVGASFSGLTFLTGAQAFTIDGNSVAFTGAVTVNSANGNTQTVNVPFTAGGLALGTDGSVGNKLALNANATVGTILFGSITNPSNTLALGSAQTLNVNGAATFGVATTSATNNAGSFIVSGGTVNISNTGAASFVLTPQSSSNTNGNSVNTLDMTGLSNFIFSTNTGSMAVGVGTRAAGTLRLANTGNLINAALLSVGDSFSGNNGGTSNVFLGAGSNVVQVNQLNIGGGKSNALMQFQTTTGSVTFTGENGVGSVNALIGRANSATGATNASQLNLAGHLVNANFGSMTVGQLAGASGGTDLAAVTFDTGVFNVATLILAASSGGTLAANGTTGTFTLGGATPNNTATGILNVSSSFLLGSNSNTTAVAAKAIFNLNGGTANINGDILSNNTGGGTATGTINLFAGTLNMMGHKIGAAPGTGVGSINLVGPGGGQSATLANLGGTGVNGAGLIMNGGGTLFLDGVNTYSGTTIVSSGTLSPTATATIAAPVYEVRNGGTLDFTQTSAPQIPAGKTISGNGTVMGNVTVGGTIAPGNNTVAGSTTGTLNFANNLSLAGGGSLAFELSNNNTSGNDAIAIGGNLDLAGTTKVKITPINGTFASGDYTLLTYASESGTGTIQAPGQGLITRQQFTLTIGATATTLNVSGTPAASLTWTGDGSTNVWDHTAPLWNNAGSSDKFFDLDSVRFDDSGSASPSVTLTGALVPASVTVDSGSNDYAFAGSGSITTDSFTKNNGRTLTIANSGVNSLGALALNGGTIIVTSNNTSAGSTTIANGAALQIGAGTTTGGTGLFASLVNNGTLVVNRSDTVIVTDNITGTGATQNLVGTLQIGNGGSTGALSSGTITNSGTLVFNRNGLVSTSVIEGTGFVRKQGTGNVTLVGSSTYTGNTVIEAGKVLVSTSGTFTAGAATLTALGSVSGGTIDVLNGAAIDVGGGAAANSVSFATKGVFIVGSGPDGNGVLTNSSTVNQQNAFANVTLKGNSTVGGTGRLDIRGVAVGGVNAATLDLAGNTLTKTGNAQFTVVGTTVTPGNIVINSGTFSAETTTTMQGAGSVNIAGDNVTVGFFNVTDPTLNVRPYFFNGNNDTLTNLSGGTPSIVGMPMILNKTINVSLNTGTTTAQGGLQINGPISGTGALIKTGNGSNSLILAGTNTYTGGTTLNAGPLITNTNFSNGTLTITGGAAKVAAKATADDPSGVTVVPALAISGGSIDLTNNAMIVDYTGATPLSSIRSAIVSGYANGAWNGAGINSSNALAAFGGANKTALGYAEASAVGITSFATKPVDGTAVVVAYTLAGDANLDFKVNALDFNAVATNFGVTGANLWQQGDFNYDGVVDTNDFTLMGQNFNFSQPLPGSPALGALVPEPASLTLLGLAAMSVAPRRRRK